ncbi:hypothetical protein BSZ22_07965 [Bradyrhizobium canariense]|uniref:Uncharacterized protein n=1 Tax=Bradyrhizobium canariense TaxID=255045 RepID=A0A1X3G1J8_9BRAD|nr:hypothetical protein BSZ22_07965 [Bradyrhizobium canariense]OSI81271.1 hypothetical protein BSZ23_07270 [Bradyrhizobium canariense]OSI94546.1 hypothetical protein BSZ25_06570 [Bradyrhizobium canariense]OSI95134.1 hypothetical protein BSZ24_08345 [Bradyrhizobium canariense]OSJ08179.1 hypothetical protein BSZ16_07790 [Bradyrhizobium canariense]
MNDQHQGEPAAKIILCSVIFETAFAGVLRDNIGLNGLQDAADLSGAITFHVRLGGAIRPSYFTAQRADAVRLQDIRICAGTQAFVSSRSASTINAAAADRLRASVAEFVLDA